MLDKKNDRRDDLQMMVVKPNGELDWYHNCVLQMSVGDTLNSLQEAAWGILLERPGDGKDGGERMRRFLNVPSALAGDYLVYKKDDDLYLQHISKSGQNAELQVKVESNDGTKEKADFILPSTKEVKFSNGSWITLGVNGTLFIGNTLKSLTEEKLSMSVNSLKQVDVFGEKLVYVSNNFLHRRDVVKQKEDSQNVGFTPTHVALSSDMIYLAFSEADSDRLVSFPYTMKKIHLPLERD